jgi:predicted SnoaL-like aldol condensation-catalyzing enzyme
MPPLEANKQLARQLIDAIWNDGRPAEAEARLAPDFVNHSAPPGTPADRAAFLRTAATTRTTFPDFHVTVDDLVAEGELVVAHFTAQGTHQVAWAHPIIGPIAPGHGGAVARCAALPHRRGDGHRHLGLHRQPLTAAAAGGAAWAGGVDWLSRFAETVVPRPVHPPPATPAADRLDRALRFRFAGPSAPPAGPLPT